MRACVRARARLRYFTEIYSVIKIPFIYDLYKSLSRLFKLQFLLYFV